MIVRIAIINNNEYLLYWLFFIILSIFHYKQLLIIYIFFTLYYYYNHINQFSYSSYSKLSFFWLLNLKTTYKNTSSIVLSLIDQSKLNSFYFNLSRFYRIYETLVVATLIFINPPIYLLIIAGLNNVNNWFFNFYKFSRFFLVFIATSLIFSVIIDIWFLMGSLICSS